jgi:hypothetical protein
MTTIDAPFARQFLHRLHASVNAHDPDALAASVGMWMQHVSAFRARARRSAHNAPS